MPKQVKVTFSAVLPCSVTAWVVQNESGDLTIKSIHDAHPSDTNPRSIAEHMTEDDWESMERAYAKASGK